MAQYNRRAEGRRPPHRGRSDRESAVLGEIRDEETIPLGNDYHTEKRDRQRQRARRHLPLEKRELNLWPAGIS
jgi:hypothetical protein